MQLRSHYPLSLLQHGVASNYLSLSQNIATDVVVMGAGIAGALVSWHLSQAGIPHVVIDKRHAGMGSTAASTGLLQYEIDTPLHILKQYVGEKNAIAAYLVAKQMVYDMQDLCNKLRVKTDFEWKPSLQYASAANDLKGLQKELAARKAIGFQVDWLTPRDLKDKYGFEKSGAILSKEAAQVDGYLLTHALLQHSVENGASVYINTEIEQIVHQRRHIILTTRRGERVKSKYLIIACGYESQRYISKRIETFLSTYAIASEPMPPQEWWYKNSLIWETANPYLYIRTTRDNRILVGGKDDLFYDPIRRNMSIKRKARLLEASLLQLLPHIPFRTDFEWAGTFAATKDGLPYIGAIPERPRTFFALGFGGNGITFSLLAAQMIQKALISGKKIPASPFSFTR